MEKEFTGLVQGLIDGGKFVLSILNSHPIEQILYWLGFSIMVGLFITVVTLISVTMYALFKFFYVELRGPVSPEPVLVIKKRPPFRAPPEETEEDEEQPAGQD